MTEADLETLLKPFLERNPAGIFGDGDFDLDVDVRGEGFSLWLDGLVSVSIPLSVTEANAKLIQNATRKLGRELTHTWAMQYTRNPEDVGGRK